MTVQEARENAKQAVQTANEIRAQITGLKSELESAEAECRLAFARVTEEERRERLGSYMDRFLTQVTTGISVPRTPAGWGGGESE